MKKLSMFGLIAVAAAGLMNGCVTSPAPEGQTSYAYAVGDRTRVTLDEVIVSLPLTGATQSYQNLHVDLAATINPLKKTPYGPYTVTDILQRLEARIGARVVESLSGMKQQSMDDMPALRSQVAREAQAVVDEAMQRWQHGSEYEVKILVVSLYWTDASVGRTPTVRRWWW
jgi:hypothetical protein